MSNPYFSSFSIQYQSQDQIICDDLSPNVNVIFGHNETGKSRVRDFIEWMMFASSTEISELKPSAAKKAYAHLDPSISGSSNIVFDNEQVKVSQKLIDGKTQTHLDSTRFTPSEISQVLTDGLSRDHYNNIFSLSLDELTKTESNKLITENELMNMFFGATVTGAGVSPPALLNELAKQKDEMFSVAKQAKNKQINRVLKEIADMNSGIKQLRLREKELESADIETEDLFDRLKEIDLKIEDISKQITDTKKILDNFEIYGQYEALLNEPKPEINSELISNVMDINMLCQSSKELLDEGDEREKERIEATLSTLKADQKVQFDQLNATISPDNMTEMAQTPQFSGIVEEEDRARTTHTVELRNIQDNVAKYSADLGSFSQEIERIQKQIDDLEKAQNANKQIEPTEVSKTTRRYHFALAPTLVSVTGLLAGVLSVVFNQPIGMVFGFVTFVAGATYQLFPSTPNDKNEISTPVTQENFLNQQLTREVESLTAKMLDYQARIEDLIEKQTAIESKRSIDAKKYIEAIGKAGFNIDITPHHVAVYLDAYKTYLDRTSRIVELEASANSTNARLDSLYDRAEKMRKIANGTKCEARETFKSLGEIHTWASALFDYAQENVRQEEKLHKKENELRDIEKKLTSSFTSLEKAKTIYSQVDINQLDAKYEKLCDEKNELSSQRTKVDHDIVRLDEQRNQASNSTAIADATQKVARLVEELKALHERYRALFVAHDVVARALENFLQENQPELLRLASSMLSSITSGEWKEITVTQSETSKSTDPIIRVSGGRANHGLSITQLSRGTREQLYLCLRMALMETSHRGKTIPALFDDIAVNSDRRRLEALAPMIGKIGQNRQVIYFTCHETTRDALRSWANARIITI